MAGGCIPIGLIALVWLAHHARRKPRVDDQGLHFRDTTVPFDAITKVDKDLWKSKGIAVIHYELDGKPDTFKMDDWKYKGAVEAQKIIDEKLGLTEDEQTEAPAEHEGDDQARTDADATEQEKTE
jgi:hypothetical protein